ncbi:MAG TPA: glycerol-3-phosphate 1-O-acyltransferase PlsY [Candidatus Bathyarchaeia archaeon]|nr:glycerol-3-phosphate 1-O-acyltransferase PlsY [Candidatus Bathyarchaeia archaeon]
MNIFLGIIFSYLLGSIPTAYIFGRVYKGIDIRDHGSGNVGATNTFRVLGKGPGITVLILDILKGLIAVWIVGDIFHVASVLGRVLAGIAAVCGHNWTIFLEFKGGKGIATSLGVLIGLTIKFPSLIFALLICILTWAGTLFLWRYISVSSMAAALILPLAMVVTGQPPEMILLGAVFCVFVIYRHRSNITRLMIGTEHKVPLKWFGRSE